MALPMHSAILATVTVERFDVTTSAESSVKRNTLNLRIKPEDRGLIDRAALDGALATARSAILILQPHWLPRSSVGARPDAPASPVIASHGSIIFRSGLTMGGLMQALLSNDPLGVHHRIQQGRRFRRCAMACTNSGGTPVMG